MLSHWLRSPLMKTSLLLHTGALASIAARPDSWPWALGAVAANHALLTAAGLWPRSTLLGPNWVRLPPTAAQRGEVAITIDDGPDPEVTPKVLDILDEHDAQASFFCIGELAVRHPELCREIVKRGHTIENHSQHHFRSFSLLGPRRMKEELQAAQETFAAITGEAPRFFRAPAGLRSPFLDPILAGLDLHLASWTRRAFDTRDGDPDSVTGKLLHQLGGGDILLLHDGHAARTATGEPVILAALPRVLAAVKSAGLHPITLRSALT